MSTLSVLPKAESKLRWQETGFHPVTTEHHFAPYCQLKHPCKTIPTQAPDWSQDSRLALFWMLDQAPVGNDMTVFWARQGKCQMTIRSKPQSHQSSKNPGKKKESVNDSKLSLILSTCSPCQIEQIDLSSCLNNLYKAKCQPLSQGSRV